MTENIDSLDWEILDPDILFPEHSDDDRDAIVGTITANFNQAFNGIGRYGGDLLHDTVGYARSYGFTEVEINKIMNQVANERR